MQRRYAPRKGTSTSSGERVYYFRSHVLGLRLRKVARVTDPLTVQHPAGAKESLFPRSPAEVAEKSIPLLIKGASRRGKNLRIIKWKQCSWSIQEKSQFILKLHFQYIFY